MASETFGPLGGAMVILGGFALVGLLMATPVVVFLAYRQSTRALLAVQGMQVHVDRVLSRSIEASSMVKECAALIHDRLACTPPAAPFMPDDAGAVSAPVEVAGAAMDPGETTNTPNTAAVPGQAVYDFCPSCKTIRFIKYKRCQTCGYHM